MKKILIVDDDLSIIRACIRSLSRDYYVFSTSTGEEALSLIKNHQPDLVILDWRLRSQIDGKEILLILKRDYPHIPVFVVTGSIHSKDEIESLGANRFLLKPVENLKEIILKALPPL